MVVEYKKSSGEKGKATTTGKIYASKTETMQKICGWERIELRHLCEALCVGYDTTVPYNFTHTAFALHKHAQNVYQRIHTVTGVKTIHKFTFTNIKKIKF